MNIAEIAELYRELIIDHSRRPRNFGRIKSPTHSAEGFNPLCGDRVYVYLTVDDGVLRDVRFEGDGCAISKASASLMTESVREKRLPEVEQLFERFHNLVTDRFGAESAGLGKLAAFSGVREFPVRVKCATLAWHTLLAALKKKDSVVSTE